MPNQDLTPIPDEVAPIHAKLEQHSGDPTVEGLAQIVNEHHEEFPPAFAWAPNLIAVLEELEARISALEERAGA